LRPSSSRPSSPLRPSSSRPSSPLRPSSSGASTPLSTPLSSPLSSPLQPTNASARTENAAVASRRCFFIRRLLGGFVLGMVYPCYYANTSTAYTLSPIARHAGIKPAPSATRRAAELRPPVRQVYPF